MEPGKKKVYTALIAVVIVLIAGVIIWSTAGDGGEKDVIPTPVPAVETPAPSRAPVNFTVETEVSVETIQDGLRDMGFLITQEYYFTEVVSNSKAVSVGFREFQKKLGLTESSFIGSYDGVVTAGIDFTKIEIEKDKASKTITVNLPRSEFKNIDIDPDSFVLYNEKSGAFTRITAEDYNDAMIGLEDTARENASQKGVLQRADENAEKIIRGFIGGFEDVRDYSIDVKFI